MNQKERHLSALSKRYGIKETEKFWCAARRAECKYSNLLLTENADNYQELREQLKEVERTTLARLTSYMEKKALFRKDILFNKDPRGYALKLDLQNYEVTNGMYRDWGGYVIVAPENFR